MSSPWFHDRDTAAATGTPARCGTWNGRTTPDETDTTYTVEYAYLLRENDGPARIEHDRHTCGLFPRAEWLRFLHAVGFRPEITHDQYDHDIFVARRPPEPRQGTDPAQPDAAPDAALQ